MMNKRDMGGNGGGKGEGGGGKDGGGHGGHNGLKSILSGLGANAFRRIRIGIGRPAESRIPVADYVLSDFYPEEKRGLEDVLWKVADAVELILRDGVVAAMNRFNGKAQEAKDPKPPRVLN